MNQTHREILEKHFLLFQISIGNEPIPMSERAIQHFENAMIEYSEQQNKPTNDQLSKEIGEMSDDDFENGLNNLRGILKK